MALLESKAFKFSLVNRREEPCSMKSNEVATIMIEIMKATGQHKLHLDRLNNVQLCIEHEYIKPNGIGAKLLDKNSKFFHQYSKQTEGLIYPGYELRRV